MIRPSRSAVRRPCAIAVGALVLAWSFAARAADRPNLTLLWDAPEGCPSADTVRRAVVELLVATRSIPPVRVHARVEREPGYFRVRIVTHRQGARGVRELEAPTCEALFDAVTIIIALAVDPELFQRAPDSGEAAADAVPAGAADTERAPAAAALERSATASGSATTPVTPASARSTPSGSEPFETDDEAFDEALTGGFGDRGLQLVAALAGSVESGALPGLGFGLTARGGLRRSRFRAELAFTRWLGRDAFSARAGTGATVFATALAGWGCFRAVPAHTAPLRELRAELPPDDQPPIEGGACVGFELGRMSARSFNASEPGSGSSGFASLGGAVRLGATAAEWLSLDVRVEALSLLHRPRFVLNGAGEVHRPEGWSLRAAMGAEVYFP